MSPIAAPHSAAKHHLGLPTRSVPRLHAVQRGCTYSPTRACARACGRAASRPPQPRRRRARACLPRGDARGALSSLRWRSKAQMLPSSARQPEQSTAFHVELETSAIRQPEPSYAVAERGCVRRLIGIQSVRHSAGTVGLRQRPNVCHSRQRLPCSAGRDRLGAALVHRCRCKVRLDCRALVRFLRACPHAVDTRERA